MTTATEVQLDQTSVAQATRALQQTLGIHNVYVNSQNKIIVRHGWSQCPGQRPWEAVMWAPSNHGALHGHEAWEHLKSIVNRITRMQDSRLLAPDFLNDASVSVRG